MIDIISIDKLLAMNLKIPDYQRPYKWTIQNIQDLLNDISEAIKDSNKYQNGLKYRIGTIILHDHSNGILDIVDGQQRAISLVLLKTYLCPGFNCPILKQSFTNKTTQACIHKNYMFICEWFALRSAAEKEKFRDAMCSILEAVVIFVYNVSEAFQLFDSQNTRGKELDPHDLLKAYHLREMKQYPYEMAHAVTKWESKDTKQIRELFDLYLFPIWNWSRGIKTKAFTVKEIDTYKGISENSLYSYARRASRAAPYFQITEPFIAGNDFFEMTDHYLNLIADIKNELSHNPCFAKIWYIMQQNSSSAGLGYTKNLFYCALLCYYDKFHNFDEMSIKKLFLWSFMIRIDMESLGFDTINRYAIGDTSNSRYTNKIAMFSKISVARLHTEISGLQICVFRENNAPASKRWDNLYQVIKAVSCVMEDDHE